MSITTETTKKNTGSTRILKEDIKTPIDSGKTAEQLQAAIAQQGDVGTLEPLPFLSTKKNYNPQPTPACAHTRPLRMPRP